MNEEILEEFLSSFEFCQTKGDVTYSEFEDYYEGLSMGVTRDKDFENIVRNTWGV